MLSTKIPTQPNRPNGLKTSALILSETIGSICTNTTIYCITIIKHIAKISIKGHIISFTINKLRRITLSVHINSLILSNHRRNFSKGLSPIRHISIIRLGITIIFIASGLLSKHHINHMTIKSLDKFQLISPCIIIISSFIHCQSSTIW